MKALKFALAISLAVNLVLATVLWHGIRTRQVNDKPVAALALIGLTLWFTACGKTTTQRDSR